MSTATTPAKYPFFPDNIEFWFEAKRAFGASSYGASEFGEVMATLDCITSGDYESWYNEWNATAERVFAEAEAQRVAGHRVSAVRPDSSGTPAFSSGLGEGGHTSG